MTDTRGLSRRDLLRLGIAAGPASIAMACGWDGGSGLAPKLIGFSRLNDWMGEKVFFSPSRLGREYPVSDRTSPKDYPAYSITYNETGTFPSVPDPARWTLAVKGLVRKPVQISRAELEALPKLTYTVKHHCVEGWTAIGTWTGVPLSVVAALVEPAANARYIRFDSFDMGYYNGWDLASAMHPQTILAYAYNERPLMMNHGAPLRLYSPVKLGYKLTKYLTTVTFTDKRPGGYWEDQGYPWFGGV